jgi:hypothetical protein
MKYSIVFLSIFFYFSVLSVSASESKSEFNWPMQHTPHPPHDHPDNDHMKKLDEWLRKSRRKDGEQNEGDSTIV